MFEPIVVWVAVEAGRPVKGLVVGMDGLDLEVSLLRRAGEELDARAPVAAGNGATLRFHSSSFGDTPPIASVIQHVVRAERTHRYTVELDDWATLAEFWAHALHRME